MNGLSKAHPRNVILLLVAFGVLASAAHAAPASLTNGVPVTGLSGTIGSETFYTIVVPADTNLASPMDYWMSVSQILFQLATTAAALDTVGAL